MNLPVMVCMSSCACHIKTLWCRSTVWWGLCGKQSQTQTQPSQKRMKATKNTKLQQSTSQCFALIFTIYHLQGRMRNCPGTWTTSTSPLRMWRSLKDPGLSLRNMSPGWVGGIIWQSQLIVWLIGWLIEFLTYWLRNTWPRWILTGLQVNQIP